jgi:hypothetical protein
VRVFIKIPYNQLKNIIYLKFTQKIAQVFDRVRKLPKWMQAQLIIIDWTKLGIKFCRLKRQLFIRRALKSNNTLLLSIKFCRLKRQWFIRRAPKSNNVLLLSIKFCRLKRQLFIRCALKSNNALLLSIKFLSFKTTMVHPACI